MRKIESEIVCLAARSCRRFMAAEPLAVTSQSSDINIVPGDVSEDAAKRRLYEMQMADASALHPRSSSGSSHHQSNPSTSGRTSGYLPLSAFVQKQIASTPRGMSPSPSVAAAPVLHDPPKAPKGTTDPEPLAPAWRQVLEQARQLYSAEDLQAAPLTDSFQRTHSYLRISLTERCNLRCLYCMPEEGVQLTPSERLLDRGEILRLARLFVGSGVDKIRLTGGEPTLRRDLVEICRDLKAHAGLRSLALTSNGIVLARLLPDLKSAGLDGVNISLDTLRADRFETMTRRKGMDKVLRSIDTALDVGLGQVKVNVVVMRGMNDDEIGDFVALTKDRPINVRFIEYMPFDGNVWSDERFVSYKEMFDRAQQALGPHAPLRRVADPKGEVAKNFRPEGYRGSVSFITSMTEHFCHECNRVRLMADGNLKVCLFGHTEVSLRDAMRGGASEEDLQYIVKAALMKKKERHAGMFEIARQSSEGRAMVQIGG